MMREEYDPRHCKTQNAADAGIYVEGKPRLMIPSGSGFPVER